MKVEESTRILNFYTRQVIRVKGRVKKTGPEAVSSWQQEKEEEKDIPLQKEDGMSRAMVQLDASPY